MEAEVVVSITSPKLARVAMSRGPLDQESRQEAESKHRTNGAGRVAHLGACSL